MTIDEGKILRVLKAIGLTALTLAATWVCVERAWSERLERDALLGTARAATCSADGRVVYLASGVAVLRSTDGGANWAVVLPQQPQQAAPQQAPAAPVAAVAADAHSPQNPTDKATARTP